MSNEADANGNKVVESPVESPVTPASESAAPESVAAAPTAAELSALREKAAMADVVRENYVRTLAELENFRKRAARDRQEAVQFANQSLFERLVPVLDNLDMALAALAAANSAPAGTGTGGTSGDALKTGVEMVLGQLRGVLRESGLEEINAAGQAFDPTWHEAVSQQETADVPEGQVVQQLRKGYRLQQRLIRPATVIVARKPQG